MRNLVYFIALSIDGKIAGPKDEVEFYPSGDDYVNWMLTEFPDVIPTHIRAQTGLTDKPNPNFDTVVYGGRTHEIGGVANPYQHLRQYVVSRSMEQPDPAIEMVSTDPLAKVRELKAEDSELDIYLAGGGELAGMLLGEIDRLVIKYYPVVAGAGYDGFGSTFNPTYFDLTDVKTFDSGNVVMYYDRKK
ncbi:MAG: dihydrofolate reductase family protein [Stackebrandtia sp.]